MALIQPVTVAVTRVLGNAGDVVLTITDSDTPANVTTITAPGGSDASAYAAFASAASAIEDAINDAEAAP